MDRDTLHEMIDACRPASQDVHLPEMQPLADAIAHDEQLGRAYQATQRADATIGKAFRDVSPPDGLATRLLDAIEEAHVELDNRQQRASTGSRFGRRKLLLAGAVLTTGLAASVVAMIWLPPVGSLMDPTDELERAKVVDAWVAELEKDPTDWQSADLLPVGFAKPRQVNARPRYWRILDGGDVVCYHLADGRGRPALLFVTKRPGTALPATPQVQAAAAYGGTVLTTAWARTDWVYVLAVDKAQGREFLEELVRLRAA